MNASIPATVGPEQFLTAGHAWQAWRAGQLDADRCGLTSIDEHGAFWIAGNLRLDLAALNKVEMLPWDVWDSAGNRRSNRHRRCWRRSMRSPR